MRSVSLAVLIVLAVLVVGIAQTQIATVTSSAPFRLRGAQVTPGQGVPSWPVMASDTIIAGTAPVSITFPDGSSITLTPGSQATISMQGAMPVFNLQSGTAQYSLRSALAVRLEARNKPVTPVTPAGRAEPAGVYSVGEAARGGGFWTPGHKAAVILGSAAAAGVGVGVALAEASSGP
jgi:hypothetical protein